MLTWLGQYLTKTIVTAIVVVASAGTVIWFWRHPEQLQLVWSTIKYSLVWIGFVLTLPWAAFSVTRWVVSLESNRAAALLLLGLSMVDALAAFWLMGGVRGHDALTWGVIILGFLAAAVYNFKVCEYQADRLENA